MSLFYETRWRTTNNSLLLFVTKPSQLKQSENTGIPPKNNPTAESFRGRVIFLQKRLAAQESRNIQLLLVVRTACHSAVGLHGGLHCGLHRCGLRRCSLNLRCAGHRL